MKITTGFEHCYKKDKPKTGSLLLDGKPIITDKPFRLLNYHRSMLLSNGISKSRLQIAYFVTKHKPVQI